jgi:hypothetical protein
MRGTAEYFFPQLKTILKTVADCAGACIFAEIGAAVNGGIGPSAVRRTIRSDAGQHIRRSKILLFKPDHFAIMEIKPHEFAKR